MNLSATNDVGSALKSYGEITQSRRQRLVRFVSVGIHLAILAWLVHSPPPVFVSPTWVRQGMNGTSLSYLYFPGNPKVARAHLPTKIVLPVNRPKTKSTPAPQPDSKYELNSKRNEATLLPDQRPIGAMYGSLSYGTISGPDVRAALPEIFPDPVLDPSEKAEANGDVVVEVTIDDQGNVIEEQLIRGLSPSIDQKVLGTISRWHFRPATRNSVPMASKQDIYYHFPR